MVLFNKLQNNSLINRSNRYISNRSLVTRCIIFLFLFILFFLLQGFGTSNVLAAGLRNEQINLYHPNPTINREYFENEIETTWQLIDEARDELKRLEQTRNSQIIDRFGDYDNELKKEFGSQNNYYLGTLKLLEANYLTLLDLHRNYSFKKEMIEEKILNNETRKGIKEKGLTAIKQLIKRNSKEYDKAQSDAERKALVEKEESLSKIKKELEEASYQDAVYLKNENNKQGGSEYNVVNTNPESIYEDNFSDHSSIVKILKEIDISPQDLRYDDNTKETLYINLKEVNQKLEDLAQDMSNIEQQESILNQEKDHYDKLSSAINIKEDKIRKLEETKQYFESKLDCKEANNSLPTLPKKKFKNVAAYIISIIKAQPQASNSLMSVKSPYISLNDPPPNPSLSMQTEILPYQVEDSVVMPLISDTTQPNNQTLTDKAIPLVNTKSLHNEFQEFATEDDGNNQRKEIITRRHSIETEQPKHYQDNKTITRTFSLKLPRPQSLDEGFFSHHSSIPESEEEEWSDSEDEPLIDTPKRFSRSSSLAPLDPQYYSRRSSDTSNLDSSDESLDSKLDDEESKPPRLYRRYSPTLPILQSQAPKIDRTQNVASFQNSTEAAVVTFPPPITQEQSSTMHAVVEQVVVYNADNKQGVNENNLELHEYYNPPKLYKTKRQKRSIAVHDIFDEDNLGLEELFKEEAVPIVAYEQLLEAEHDADEHLVADHQPLVAAPQPPANVVHVENNPPAVQPLAAAPQPPADVVHVENNPPAVQPLAAAPQPPANVVLVENNSPAVQPLEAVPQPPANVVHVENNPPAVQPLAAAPQPPANVVHVENNPPAVQPLEAVPQPPANVVHVENNPPAVQPLAANEQHLIPNDQPQKDEHDIFDEDNLGLEELFKEEDVPIVTNDQAQEAEHDADKRLVANDQPQKDEHLVANEQLPEPEHPADEQLISDVQPIATATEPQISAETTILAEKESYISPINFDIEQNIAKYTTYIEFDYLDLISNALSTRNNLLKPNRVNMVAAGDNDYYIKKGGWIQVMNSTSKQKGNTLPFKNNQQGFVLGFDAQPLDELIIGIAYANANSYTKFQSIFNDKQNIILHVAAVYSKYTLSQNMYLSSYLKYGKAFIKNLGKRDTISINSKTNGYVGRAKLETHYKVDLDKFLFKPMVGIIFDHFLIKNFTEYRKDFNINVPTRKGKRVSFETGIDFSKRILVRNISIIPKVHFKLDQTVLLNNSTDIINFTSIEHHTQTVAITKSLRPSPKNVMYTLGGCINMQSVSALELGAGYDYSLKKSFTTHSFYVNGSVKF
ncbi:autotransporter domain-containing protein [Candidatus Tisiphia endosymbiont of Temnostethus pusillus]|uniref:autotransporter domain-containing protein n=1 Tax=Candidatus Tisiphia endosymbiont of Temnostethus pusillus TaxID=3139335 RepID=UPI0035C935AA